MAEKEVFPKVVRIVTALDSRTGISYEEKRVYQYDPKLKYNVQLSSKRTGRKKLPGSDEWVATRPKKPRKTKQKSGEPSASRSKETSMKLLAWTARESGISGAVRRAFPDGGTADKILSVSQFLVMTGDTINNISDFQYEHDLPYAEGLSEDTCYNLFEDLGKDEAGTQALFKALVGIAGTESPVLALDSTTVSTYSESDEGLKPFARAGYNKERDGLDTFKLTTFYSVDSNLPVSFELQPGNIPDVSSVFNGIRRAQSYGLKKPQFVLDNGFFSKDNVTTLCRSHVKFTMRATLTDKWIYEPFEGNSAKGLEPLGGGKFSSPSATCPFDTTTKGVSTTVMTLLSWSCQKSSGNKTVGDQEQHGFRLYYHYYLNRQKHLLETDNFDKKLFELKSKLERRIQLSSVEQAQAEKYLVSKVVKGGSVNVKFNDEAIEEAKRNCGVFSLISNVDKDPWVALLNYRKRNLIESSYKVIKSDMDGRKPRVWTMVRERGKEVCRLVALGIRFYLADAINLVKEKAYINSQDEKNFTKKQRDEYEALGNWIESKTLKQILSWFDCIETVAVKNARGKVRWTTESIRRDQLFLKMLYEL